MREYPGISGIMRNYAVFSSRLRAKTTAFPAQPARQRPGPRCAKRTALVGKQTRGGLGKPTRHSCGAFPWAKLLRRLATRSLAGLRPAACHTSTMCEHAAQIL